jgi:cystathionine beta-lyase
MPAVGVAIRAFSNPGDGVIIQPPVYPPFFRIIEDNRRVIVESPLLLEDGYFRMDFDNLKARLSDPGNRILMLCSPHNPVGRVWERDELEKLGRLCVDTGTLLISDEIHADLVFDPFRHTPTASISPAIAGNVIACVSPSKTFNIPGLQTAYAVIPDRELREAFQVSLRAAAIGSHNNFGLVAGDAAYREGGPWRISMLDYIMANRDYAISFFKKEMPWVSVRPPEGTYLLWLDFSRCELAESELNDRLINRGKVVLDPGSWFGREWSGWQRLNIGCPRSLLEEGLKRILSAFSDL